MVHRPARRAWLSVHTIQRASLTRIPSLLRTALIITLSITLELSAMPRTHMLDRSLLRNLAANEEHLLALILMCTAAFGVYISGGNCEYSFTRERTQAHDRHILTHLPDDEGYSRVNFVCKACPAKSCRTYCRLDAVARHIRVDHGTKDSELSQILGVPWCKPTFIHSTTAVLPY